MGKTLDCRYMTKKGSKYYWRCQIGGWGSLALLLVLNSTTLEQKITRKDVQVMMITVLTGILVTHIFREVIKHSGWALLTVEKALPKFLVGIVLTCIAIGLTRIGLADALNLVSSKSEFMPRLLIITADTSVMIIPWTLIYYFYHYIQISSKQQLDTFKLEALVKELELK